MMDSVREQSVSQLVRSFRLLHTSASDLITQHRVQVRAARTGTGCLSHVRIRPHHTAPRTGTRSSYRYRYSGPRPTSSHGTAYRYAQLVQVQVFWSAFDLITRHRQQHRHLVQVRAARTGTGCLSHVRIRPHHTALPTAPTPRTGTRSLYRYRYSVTPITLVHQYLKRCVAKCRVLLRPVIGRLGHLSKQLPKSTTPR